MMVVGKQCEQHEQYNCQRHVICAAGGFHFVQRWCKVSVEHQTPWPAIILCKDSANRAQNVKLA